MKVDLNKLSTQPPESISETEAGAESELFISQLSDIQAKLYAQGRYSVLVVFQGMDASGKDGAVKNVFSGVNPAGCRVKSFKVPTEQERRHNFLWRIHRECPEKGMIQIFNRSHYEDVLVPHVHRLEEPEEISQRMNDINAFENLLLRSGTIILKFYLHISAAEQENRINQRLTDPLKRWKYQESDIIETRHRNEYERIYEVLFQKCNTVPWRIVPADKKWYRNYFILQSLLEELKKCEINFPNMK